MKNLKYIFCTFNADIKCVMNHKLTMEMCMNVCACALGQGH